MVTKVYRSGNTVVVEYPSSVQDGDNEIRMVKHTSAGGNMFYKLYTNDAIEIRDGQVMVSPPRNWQHYADGTGSTFGTLELLEKYLSEEVFIDGGEAGCSCFYEHEQSVASAVWTIAHNLERYPSVTSRDASDVPMRGCVAYVDNNNLTITFTAADAPYAIDGYAYLI